ncbi:MAG: DUF58 domain-containing protein [Akkermansiaceae bacterium]
MRKRRLSITRKGAALSGGAVAMVISGLFTAEGIFFLLGICGLLLILLCYLLGKINLIQLTPSIHMPANVAAGRMFELELSIHNKRILLDAFNVQMDISLPCDSVFSAQATWTAAGQCSQTILQGTIPSRGYADQHSILLSSQFPLGLFRMIKIITLRREVVVTPMPIIPMELNSHGSLHDALPHSGLSTGNSFGEPRGIRPWQAGDSSRHIHWAASARALACGHDLRIREFDPPGFHPDQCHIIFHSYASGREMLRQDRFERALSLLAGTITELQGKGIPCVLSADFLDWEPVSCQSRKQMVEFLKTLAKVQRAKGTESHDLDHAIRTTSPDQAVVIISDMPPDSWSHLTSRSPNILAIDIRQIRYGHRTLHAATA